MSVSVCPFCGPRAVEEFVFHKTVAESAAGEFSAIYERLDRPTMSREHWQHLHGCGAWLYVQRNPSTGAVLSIRLEGAGEG